MKLIATAATITALATAYIAYDIYAAHSKEAYIAQISKCVQDGVKNLDPMNPMEYAAIKRGEDLARSVMDRNYAAGIPYSRTANAMMRACHTTN